MSNKKIAAALCISNKTASFHVSNIIKKLGVESRIEAANMLKNWQISEPDNYQLKNWKDFLL
jgi:DNA-binding NarL/FixJ family response regulator